MIVGVDVNLRRVTACRIGVAPKRALPRPGIDFITWSAPATEISIECPRHIAHSVRQKRIITATDVVWIERPNGRHIKSVADLSRVMGAFIASLPLQTSIEEVGSPEWKHLVGLPGNCGKPAIREWAVGELKRRGYEHAFALDEHQCDALAIAVACERESARYTEDERKVIA